MSATPYVPLGWNDNEPLATQKLNIMANNEQWLFENTPRAFYNAQGAQNATGVKFLGGIASVPAWNGPNIAVNVQFSTFFSAGCVPIITTGVIGYPQVRFVVSIRGIGTAFPDQRGFELHVGAAELTASDSIVKQVVYIPYIAMGW